MVTQAPLTLTGYERRYRRAVLDLLFKTYQSHIHLDWHETELWLDTQDVPMRLAWQGRKLAGILAVSRPLNDTCWIRLAAVDDPLPAPDILQPLWKDLQEELRTMNIRQVALLISRRWIDTFLPDLGFRYLEDVVTLQRAGGDIPEVNAAGVTIRVADMFDLDVITVVDQSAFGPPWQLAQGEVHQAMRIASSCTVALRESQVVGYQITTLYRDTAHLARLAVLPDQQGMGIGAVLLEDMLVRFQRRGIWMTTVNTQASNTRSQRLYARFGFERNGYDLPVWVQDVSP